MKDKKMVLKKPQKKQPKVTTSFRLKAEVRAKLERLAEEYSISMTDVVNQIVMGFEG